MKTFRKSSLISSVALLLVAIVALSGATFAWFSSNTQAETGNISMTASSASSIYIVDDTANITSLGNVPTSGWTNDLDWNEDITKMAPASTTIDRAFQPTFFYTTSSQDDGKWTDADIKSTTAETKDGTRYFVAKKIWVYADGTNENSVLTGNVTITSNKGTLGYERIAIVDATDANAEPIIMAASADTAGAFTDDQGTTDPVAAEAAGTFTYTGVIDQDNAKCYVIYCWFEGQDANCKNSNAAQNYEIALDFSVAINEAPAQG